MLLLWKWVGVKSIAMFCRNSMESFIDSGKDVLYDLLKREDINLHRYNLSSALQVYSRHGLDQGSMQVLVLDDSIKQRRGRKMEGVSRHFDHTSGRFVMSQLGNHAQVF